MHSFTVDCDTFSNLEKVTVVVPVTSIETTVSVTMLILRLSTLLVMCLMRSIAKMAKKST